MRTSGKLIVALAMAGLVLQGCAADGSRPDAAPVASAQASAPQASAPAAPNPAPQAAAIPEKGGKPVVAANTKDDFDAIAAAIRQQMQPGGRFAFVDSKGRSSVNMRLDDMSVLFNRYGTVDGMSADAQSRLLDDQNTINEVLARYDSNRLICREEVPVGSHFPKRVCRTLGQIQQEQNNAQQMMRINQMRGSQIGGH